MNRTLKPLAALAALACLALPAAAGPIQVRAAPAGPGMPLIRFTPFSTGLPLPIGIDFHEPSNSLIVSVNYADGGGGFPHNFRRVSLVDGSHTQFSNVSGWPDEIKIGAVRSGGPQGGWTVGDLFTANGQPGQIARISNNGALVQSPWATLPGVGVGPLRGSLHIDRVGSFGGDLLALSDNGRFFRVTPGGAATQIANLNTRIAEGIEVVPNDPARYGPLAGRALVGGEDQGLLYAVSPNGNVLSFNLGFTIEDVDLIVFDSTFYGVDHLGGRVMRAGPENFRDFVGDFLLINEHPDPGTSGLYRLFWDGAAVRVQQFGLAPGSPFVELWEHGTIIGSVVPEPGTLTIAAFGSLGLLGYGWRRWRTARPC